MAKELIEYRRGDEIPSTAKFICSIYEKGEHIFIYEEKTSKQKSEKQKQKEEEHNKTIERVIDYFNRKTGSRISNSTKSIRDLIKARLNEKAKPEDFKAVIDNKFEEWNDDPTTRVWIRPSTLFGPKFQEYLPKELEGNGGLKEVFNELEQINEGVLNEFEGN